MAKITVVQSQPVYNLEMSGTQAARLFSLLCQVTDDPELREVRDAIAQTRYDEEMPDYVAAYDVSKGEYVAICLDDESEVDNEEEVEF